MLLARRPSDVSVPLPELQRRRRKLAFGLVAILLAASIGGCASEGGGGTDLSIATPHGAMAQDGNLAQETTASVDFH